MISKINFKLFPLLIFFELFTITLNYFFVNQLKKIIFFAPTRKENCDGRGRKQSEEDTGPILLSGLYAPGS